MHNFKPISQVLAALLLAVFCFSDMPLDVIIKAVKKE